MKDPEEKSVTTWVSYGVNKSDFYNKIWDVGKYQLS